jgi:hypothetical protein
MWTKIKLIHYSPVANPLAHRGESGEGVTMELNKEDISEIENFIDERLNRLKDIFLSDNLSRPVELWAEKECPACLGEGNIPMSDGYSSHPCTLCDNGLIRRQLTAGEVIEIPKLLLEGEAFIYVVTSTIRYIVLPTGERVTGKEPK